MKRNRSEIDRARARLENGAQDTRAGDGQGCLLLLPGIIRVSESDLVLNFARRGRGKAHGDSAFACDDVAAGAKRAGVAAIDPFKACGTECCRNVIGGIRA